MIRYAIRRILILIPVLLAVLTITFFLVNLAPGSPFSSPKVLSAEVLANLKAKYGFDQPRAVQYWRFMARLGGFTYHSETHSYTFRPVPDFGDSIKYKGRTVNEIIGEALPVSAVLGVAAYLIALFIGLASGIASALRPNTWIDRSISAMTMLGVSIPSFVLDPRWWSPSASRCTGFRPRGSNGGGSGASSAFRLLPRSCFLHSPWRESTFLTSRA